MGTDYESIIERINLLESKFSKLEKARVDQFLALEKHIKNYYENDDKDGWDKNEFPEFEDYKKSIKYSNSLSAMRIVSLLEDLASDLFETFDVNEKILVFKQYGADENLLRSIPYKDYKTETNFQYYSNYWDGPLSGMIEADNNKYWFQCLYDLEEIWSIRPRIHMCYKMSEEEIAEELKWYALFNEFVSTRNNMTIPQEERVVRPSHLHHKYYEPAKSRPVRTYTNNEKAFWIIR